MKKITKGISSRIDCVPAAASGNTGHNACCFRGSGNSSYDCRIFHQECKQHRSEQRTGTEQFHLSASISCRRNQKRQKHHRKITSALTIHCRHSQYSKKQHFLSGQFFFHINCLQAERTIQEQNSVDHGIMGK